MNVEFTAEMEDHLDKVEDGEREWVATVKKFFEPFKRDLARAKKEMENEKKGTPTGSCARRTAVSSSNGAAGSAPSSPAPTTRSAATPAISTATGERRTSPPTKCPSCGKPMVIKHGRYGKFIACSGYPECKTTKPVTLGIACPACSGEELVERRSKRGRTFYGCSAYPDCKFVLWRRPIPEPCPQCGAPFLTERPARGRTVQTCAKEGCDFRREAELPVA